MNEIALRLTAQQVQIVMAGLAELPLRVSAQTFMDIQRQCADQEKLAAERQAETGGAA